MFKMSGCFIDVGTGTAGVHIRIPALGSLGHQGRRIWQSWMLPQQRPRDFHNVVIKYVFLSTRSWPLDNSNTESGLQGGRLVRFWNLRSEFSRDGTLDYEAAPSSRLDF